MISVQLQPDGTYERIAGNPIILSIDGEVQAPLRVILHESWTDEDRAKFGVYVATPFTVPEGKRTVGQPRYEKRGDIVVELFDVEDVPVPPVEAEPSLSMKLSIIGVTIEELKAALK